MDFYVFSFRFGFIAGTHPVKTILISVVFALLCLAGLLRHEEESRGEKLWIDQDSTFIVDQTWVLKQFPTKIRYINLIVKRNDILTPKGLLEVSMIIFVLFFFKFCVHLNDVY